MVLDSGQKVNSTDVERLVKAGRGGSREAFNELVRLYQRRAMRVAVGMLGNVDDAAEAVQAGFVRAYLGIGKLKKPEQFEAWLLRIIANTAISQQRAAKRRTEKIKIAGYYKDKKAGSPVRNGIADELKDAIQRAMLKLSKKEAKAIGLFGLKDLSHREVAEIMGCSVEAVRWYVFRARRKLRVLLKEYL